VFGCLPNRINLNCWDNAVAESFWSTIKAELIHDVDFPSRATAEQAIFEDIEVFYNRRRRHSTIGYRTPVQQEQIYEAARQPTASENCPPNRITFTWRLPRPGRCRAFTRELGASHLPHLDRDDAIAKRHVGLLKIRAITDLGRTATWAGSTTTPRTCYALLYESCCRPRH
jgi:hypothetical protein